MSGIYFDDYSTNWVADQNILWNNEPYNIFVNEGAIPTGSPQPSAENINIVNNTIPDVSDESYIILSDIMSCGTTPDCEQFSSRANTANRGHVGGRNDYPVQRNEQRLDGSRRDPNDFFGSGRLQLRGLLV